MKRITIVRYTVLAIMFTAILFIACPTFNSPVRAGDNETIIELWDRAKAPPPVELKAVKLDPKETAFLVLDIEELTCNPKRRPRCIDSVPKIKGFLDTKKSVPDIGVNRLGKRK